ncbi:MAG TPA: glycosyltransferase family 4 protein [Burkholderiaceae bacterium]|nr:glycosyltransferase family 4 protein [Burkholderiaceae bacterium]
MRVLVLTTFFPNAADPQRAVFVKNLVRALKQRCKVDVISPIPYAPPFSLKAAWRAQRAIPMVDTIDGIEVTHPRFVVLPRLEWLSGLTYFLGVVGALRTWKRQLADGEKPVVHVHCAYPDAVGAVLAAKLTGIPCVVTAHGSDINVYAKRTGLRGQIRWALRNAHGIIAVSGGLQNDILAILGAPSTKVRRIPCAGFDMEVFRIREGGAPHIAPKVGLGARLVIFVGLLVPIKGVEFLIEAWAALAQAGKIDKEDRLVLLGDGPLRTSLMQQARARGIEEQIFFAGMVSQQEVACWISSATLLCLPSRNEGTPNVVVEALASGVPVVASRVGGIPDLVKEGENGMLVPPADPLALGMALEEVLRRSWNCRHISRSVAHLTWQAIADQNHEFLQSTVTGS